MKALEFFSQMFYLIRNRILNREDNGMRIMESIGNALLSS